MQVSAVVANEPFLSGEGNIGKAIHERGALKVYRLVAAAVIDKVSVALHFMLEQAGHAVLPFCSFFKNGALRVNIAYVTKPGSPVKN